MTPDELYKKLDEARVQAHARLVEANDTAAAAYLESPMDGFVTHFTVDGLEIGQKYTYGRGDKQISFQPDIIEQSTQAQLVDALVNEATDLADLANGRGPYAVSPFGDSEQA